MQVKVARVKAERQKRAWTQEHLAAAADLGLRTVQRVEASGLASNETIKSLASVFECSIEDLLVTNVGRPGLRLWKRPLSIGAALCFAIASMVFFVSRATAGQVMLDVILGGDNPNVKVFKLMTEAGHQAEARLDQQLRIVLTPTLQQDDLILLSAEIYSYDGQEFRLLSTPKLLTRDGVDAQIRVGLDDGKSIQMSIRPKRM
jgi:transcriptional regulator with XRE-family HTH domain